MPSDPAFPPAPEPSVGDRYRSTRERLTALLEPLDADGWATPVAACPGWSVRDVQQVVVVAIAGGAERSPDVVLV